MGNLVIVAPSLLIWLGGLSAVALVLAARRRRAHGTGASILVLAGLLLLVTGADAVNVHFSYLPRLEDLVGHPTWPTASTNVLTQTAPAAGIRPRYPDGAVIRLSLPGTVSHFEAHAAFVYLPPQYFTDPSARFPVVYLLHGSPGAPIDWVRSTDAAGAGLAVARAGHPMILVAPQVSRNWTDDSECVDRPSERIETYLVTDVVTAVDARLRTIPAAADRAVAGISAGGFCALDLGLRHRGEFGTIIDLSGLDRPTHVGGMVGLFGRSPELAALVAAHDPAVFAALLPATPLTRVWLDAGRSDTGPRRSVEAMATVLAARGLDVHLQLRPGGHDYATWVPALRQSLAWFGATLPRAPLPTCVPTLTTLTTSQRNV